VILPADKKNLPEQHRGIGRRREYLSSSLDLCAQKKSAGESSPARHAPALGLRAGDADFAIESETALIE
jgi:hypothetical protein